MKFGKTEIGIWGIIGLVVVAVGMIVLLFLSFTFGFIAFTLGAVMLNEDRNRDKGKDLSKPENEKK